MSNPSSDGPISSLMSIWQDGATSLRKQAHVISSDFKNCKNDDFQIKSFDIFLFLLKT